MNFPEAFCRAIGIDPDTCLGLQITMETPFNLVTVHAKLEVLLDDELTTSLKRYKFTVEEIA